jgi:hypothetical protein
MDSNTLIIIIHNHDPCYNNPLYDLDYNNGVVIQIGPKSDET